MLHGAILGSPYAHARIKSYNMSAASRYPGVGCGFEWRGCQQWILWSVHKDETVLAKNKVRYVGEPVCIVAAVDELTPARPPGFIEVEYEELGEVLSPEEALASGAPVIHEDNESYVRVHETECGGKSRLANDICRGRCGPRF